MLILTQRNSERRKVRPLSVMNRKLGSKSTGVHFRGDGIYLQRLPTGGRPGTAWEGRVSTAWGPNLDRGDTEHGGRLL